MAKKAKKSEPRDLSAEVDRLIQEVGDDRDVLLKFLEGLISEYDGEKAVGIAEYVAKLADALTRQHQVKAAVIKAALAKATQSSDENELDELHGKIGLPFKTEEVDDGSN